MTHIQGPPRSPYMTHLLRPVNCGGSWEPSSKKEFELQESFQDIEICINQFGHNTKMDIHVFSLHKF